MKAALYTRVSTLEQARDGYSLQAQEEKLKKYAAYQSYEIAGVFTDDGYSGGSLARPALTRLLSGVKEGKIQVVLIYKLDRLSRRVRDVLEMVDLFQEHGVTLYSLSENLDLSSPFGRAALKMSATFSEMEREVITERMTMGKDQRVKQGKMLPSRVAPFGYRYDVATHRFVIVPEEAEIVRKLFDLYLQGYSFRKLHDYARATFHHPYFGKNNPMSCKPVIKRVMYAGYVLYKGELYPGVNFEPVVSYETWLKAQRRAEENKTRRQSPSSPYLLTGLVYCGLCGNRYVGKLYDRNKPGKKDERYRYRSYGCAARVKRDKKYRPAACRNVIIPTKDLEYLVEDSVRRLKITGLAAEERSGTADRILAENAALAAKKEKLLDLYLDGSIDKDSFQTRVAEIEKHISNNEKILKREAEQMPATPTVTAEYLIERQREYDNLDRVEKQKLLRFLIKKIVVAKNDVRIEWRVTFAPPEKNAKSPDDS